MLAVGLCGLRGFGRAGPSALRRPQVGGCPSAQDGDGPLARGRLNAGSWPRCLRGAWARAQL
eukprot:14023639-Alexandrium_andersonii.AAC.1